MHEIRSSLARESAAPASPLRTKEPCRRQKAADDASLVGLPIRRLERRSGNQRQVDRHRDVIETAVIAFRGKRMTVDVINLSDSGVMIECDIEPRIGETIAIKFAEFRPLSAIVRWVKAGRIGLDVGEGGIALFEI